MPISINKDSINFGNYSISLHPNGIEIDGKFKYGSYAILPPQAQGSISGYTSGGFPAFNTIDKFPFSSDANATDVGDLTQSLSSSAGQSSLESGYTSGGSDDLSSTNVIDKFPFAVDANATDVGDLSQDRGFAAGQSSTESGYTSGGLTFSPAEATSNIIDKFPFATDANATDVGDLTQARYGSAGQSSAESGYTSGGATLPGFTNVIDKFPFAVDANATDVGDLTQARRDTAGQSSTESGYNSGGLASGSVTSNIIDKFPFATDGNATDVGDLTQARRGAAGQSSTVSGYSSGGGSPPAVATIDKFPFVSDVNATDVGDLTQARRFVAGQQV
jgi:hypothetical protein